MSDRNGMKQARNVLSLKLKGQSRQKYLGSLLGQKKAVPKAGKKRHVYVTKVILGKQTQIPIGHVTR